MANPDFNTIATHTIKNYRAQLADNLTGHEALLWELKEGGYVREDDGGTSIVESLMYGQNETVKSYSGYETIDTTPQEGFTSAEYAWKQIAGSITISGMEKFQNQSSKAKILNLLQSKMTQLEMSMQLEVSRMLHGDGSGNGGKDLTGLGVQVEDGAAWSTVGGIDSNVHTWWRNQWIGGTAAFSSVGKSRMTTLYNSISRKGVRPKTILTSQPLFEAYELSLTDDKRFMDSRLADAGFLNLTFKGTPIVFDSDMPYEDLGTDEHQMVMITPEFLNFVIGKGKNFVVTPFQRPDNQDAEVALIFLYANLTCSNRGRQGRLTDLTV